MLNGGKLELLKRSIRIDHHEWKNVHKTNCYAYALNADIPEHKLKTCIYQPGYIANSKELDFTFTKTDFIEGLESDLKLLEIEYKYCKINEELLCNEWKILIMLRYYQDHLYNNFHFLKQYKDEPWMHKLSYFNPPTLYIPDSMPDYEYIDCMKLSLKK